MEKPINNWPCQAKGPKCGDCGKARTSVAAYGLHGGSVDGFVLIERGRPFKRAMGAPTSGHRIWGHGAQN